MLPDHLGRLDRGLDIVDGDEDLGEIGASGAQQVSREASPK
jgi:hypothetical protein